MIFSLHIYIEIVAWITSIFRCVFNWYRAFTAGRAVDIFVLQFCIIFYLYWLPWPHHFTKGKGRFGPIKTMEVHRTSQYSEKPYTYTVCSYAHDEWSIGDLLDWLNYPSIPITFPCFESRGAFFSLVLNIAEKLLAGR